MCIRDRVQAVVTGSTKKGEISDSINGENISTTEFDKRLDVYKRQ